jgi:hypothetical protein
MEQPIAKKVVVKSILFTNWTKEDFTCSWDGVEYDFPAGHSMYLQDYLAHHFAKHLAQRECNRKKINFNSPEFQEFGQKCFSGQAIESDSSLKLEVEMAKANSAGGSDASEVEKMRATIERQKEKIRKQQEIIDKKSSVKTSVKKDGAKPAKDEESFEGLNDKKNE